MTSQLRPSGTVTFLFTDIEGSTGLWESDAKRMRAALIGHDEVLRSAIEAGGGWLFKHTGDGACAAFSSAGDALSAAIDAQRRLELPVRMGVGTGTAEQRGEDYFGAALNRAARVMAAGHGGQILASAATAALADGFDLVDLGRHRLRDLSGVHRIFQVRAEGLRTDFPPLRTLDSVPGNLPVQTTSFVGRQAAIEELVAVVRTHRLVTLTGVGGVGKTRLALQVAGELVPEFAEGAWLVELAAVGDPAALPDAVATGLGVTPQAGRSVTERIAEALSGRRLLLLLDNCEHMLDAAAELVQAILTRTKAAHVIATSREGLRLPGEHLWAVPSLGVQGEAAEGVELFVERAREVNARFSLHNQADAAAVSVICRRLDGIPLAIELAAARMVSMSAREVQDRLDDRFRLLAGGRRGVERHHTLRQAVGWSYDLLDDAERAVLGRCSVFAGGFDLEAAAHLCDRLDDYTVLDMLDSLVRKSLVTVEVADGHTRYGLLETIRQYAEEQLAATDDIAKIRDRHARYYAAQAETYWDLYEGPRQREALDWVDIEFPNLRTGFRWATDRDDLPTAAAIAAHTTMIAWVLQRFESVGWAEELLAAASAADLPQLPRLYTAAAACMWSGRPDAAVSYIERAWALEADSGYDAFEPGFSQSFGPTCYALAGRVDRGIEICSDLAASGQPTGMARSAGGSLLLWLLVLAGRADEARLIAEDNLAVARAYANPVHVGIALVGYGFAFAETDPPRALRAYREDLAYCREHRFVFVEAISMRDAAWLEALHGDVNRGLELFDSALDVFHRSGNHAQLAQTFAELAVCFDHIDVPEVAATFYGAYTGVGTTLPVPGLPDVVGRLVAVLGESIFYERVSTGAALELGEAVAYARRQVRQARQSVESAPRLP